MKNVANILNRAKIYGFEKDPKYSISEYLNKERVKRQSIAEIRKEHIIEARMDDSAAPNTTSLNQTGTSKKIAESKEDIATKRHDLFHVRKENSKSITSFGQAQKGTVSLSRPGVGNVSIGGGSFRPKF